MIAFVGPELIDRQNLQKAQKAQVTKRVQELARLAKEQKQEIAYYQEKYAKERSRWRNLLKTFYLKARAYGFKDSQLESYFDLNQPQAGGQDNAA